MDEARPRQREYTEGKGAARRFENIVKAVMTIPSTERQKQAPAWRKNKKEVQKSTVLAHDESSNGRYNPA